MEFEDVSESLEWQARRVAAAFGAKNWRKIKNPHSEEDQFKGHVTVRGDKVPLVVAFLPAPYSFEVGVDPESILVTHWQDLSSLEPALSDWEIYGVNPLLNELMARGLYCLGIEDEEMVNQLKHSLSAHEKLELRLAMPREFWPQKWLDEEA